MHYTEAYNFLISLNNLPRKEYMADPRHCGWYLKRLQFFLDILGNPEKKIPHYVHVTGTSGKGSVCNMMNSILHASGKKVGLLTSPHPSVILERWKINGRPMPKKDFVKVVEEIKPKLDEYIRTTPYDMLSYSEVSTAIALYYFAKQKADWAVLEVGCGGRYDATNVIPYKDVAVITNIELDHKGTIGETKEEIAYEKAGIVKREALVFTGEADGMVLEIIESECAKNKVVLNKIAFSRNTYHITHNKNIRRDTGCEFEYKNNTYSLPILGEHQVKNAILTIEVAKALKIPENKIKQGLKNVKIPICMEIVSRKPLIILDGAHNPEKMKTTIATLQHLNTATLKHLETKTNKSIHLIIGFADNKDWPKMIKQLVKLNLKSIACTRFSNNPFRKAANPKLIADKFEKALSPPSLVGRGLLVPKKAGGGGVMAVNTKIQIFLDPLDALAWSKKQILSLRYSSRKKSHRDRKTISLILTTGSIFLSGELRKKILIKNN